MLILSLILSSSLFILAASQQRFARVLLYTATTGYRHDSILAAISALEEHGPSINIAFESTEDRSRFNDETLAAYDAVVFLSTTGEVLDTAGQAALQNYVNKGGNFVGIHSASDTLRNVSFFVRQIGSKFHNHPDLQEAAFEVIGPPHPSTEGLPSPWRVRDEIYNFESDPRDLGATVVLTVDESSYTDDEPRLFDQGSPHPIAWYQDRGAGVDGSVGGRSFYTSLGHLNETWQDPTFMSHVLGGIKWTLESNTTRAFNSEGMVGNSDPALTSSGEPPESSPASLSASVGRPTSGLEDSSPDGSDSDSGVVRMSTSVGLAAGTVIVANMLS